MKGSKYQLVWYGWDKEYWWPFITWGKPDWEAYSYFPYRWWFSIGPLELRRWMR